MALGYEESTEYGDSVKALFWVPTNLRINRETDAKPFRVLWKGWISKASKDAEGKHVGQYLLDHTYAEIEAVAPGLLALLLAALQDAAKEQLGWDTATNESE